MMRIRFFVILAVIACLLTACGGGAPSKAGTPSSIVSAVKVGMSTTDVSGVVDLDEFTANKAFVTINCSKLTISGDSVVYEATKDIDSPYFMWLFFGTIVQDLNPAVVAFSANPERVIGMARMDFNKAQELVEWQSGRPFRR